MERVVRQCGSDRIDDPGGRIALLRRVVPPKNEGSVLPMKPMLSRLIAILGFCLCGLVMSPSVQACAVCFANAQTDSPLAQGAQKGILTLMIVTYSVVIGLVGMFIFQITYARRRRPTPPVSPSSQH